MGTPDTTDGKQEPLPTQKEVVRRLAGLHADRLLYRQLWENADMGDEEFEKMKRTERDIYALVVQTLPRIQAEEITGIKLIESPVTDQFYLALPGDRLRISMNTPKVEEEFPSVREMISPWEPPKP